MIQDLQLRRYVSIVGSVMFDTAHPNRQPIVITCCYFLDLKPINYPFCWKFIPSRCTTSLADPRVSALLERKLAKTGRNQGQLGDKSCCVCRNPRKNWKYFPWNQANILKSSNPRWKESYSSSRPICLPLGTNPWQASKPSQRNSLIHTSHVAHRPK